MRIGILSFAHLHAEGYIGNLRAAPDVEMIGFSDSDAERGRHFAELFNTRWFPTHEALLAEAPDGVIVCSENANHRELVELAAGAGAHVLCEKPIEVTLADAEAMRAACDAGHVHFMTAFPVRFAASTLAVKALLERGDLGRIYAVNGINHSEIPRAHRAWFAQKALAGGGAVMDHTVHLVDMLRWCFGCEVAEVYAEVDNLFYPGEVDVDTAGLVLLTMQNGVIASVDCSWSRPTWYPRWGHLKFDIVGDNGFTVVDALSQHHTVYSRGAARNPAWVGWGSDSNQGMINEFAASIREQRPPSVTWKDGYEALRVALACYESAAAGQPVKLEHALAQPFAEIDQLIASLDTSGAVGQACVTHGENRMSLLITNARIILPTAVYARGWLLAEGKTIRFIGKGDAPTYEGAQVIDAGGKTLIPGFVDLHVHGAVGHETMDANPDGLRAMARYYAQHGVTGFLPTTWTAQRDRIVPALEMVLEMRGPQPEGAAVLAAHLEGPFINAAKRGAQREQDVRRAGREEALAYLALGIVRLLVLAPEFEENRWLIGECVRRGVTVSIAHSNASYEQVVEAERLGLSHATHTYNAMVGLGHRDPGAIGAIMTLPDIYAELIADNIHVHPAAMQALYKAKGADRVVLITDAVRGAGMPDGEHLIDDRIVVVKDGAVRLPDGTLAGSTLTMERALANFMKATGEPLEKVWQTSSLNALRSLHLSALKGSIEVGKDADLVLVDSEIHVSLTVVEGQVAYRK